MQEPRIRRAPLLTVHQFNLLSGERTCDGLSKLEMFCAVEGRDEIEKRSLRVQQVSAISI